MESRPALQLMFIKHQSFVFNNCGLFCEDGSQSFQIDALRRHGNADSCRGSADTADVGCVSCGVTGVSGRPRVTALADTLPE